MVIPEGYANISLVFNGAGIEGDAVTSIAIRNDAGASASAIGALLAVDAVNFVDQCCTENVVCHTIAVKLGPDATGALHEEPVNIPGDQGSDGVNPQVALLFRKTTALGGRRGRGRMFVPAPPDVMDEVTGLWDGAAITQFQTAADTFLAALNADDLIPVLLHSNSLTPTPLTGLLAVSRSGSQRRRNRR